jgi:hypothetical protein
MHSVLDTAPAHSALLQVWCYLGGLCAFILGCTLAVHPRVATRLWPQQKLTTNKARMLGVGLVLAATFTIAMNMHYL